MLKINETQIQASICDYLAMKGYFFWRVNNIPVYDTTRKIYRALPKYTPKGISDIIVIIKGIFYGLEVKTDKGRQSPEQKIFQEDVERSGGKYFIVRSIDDVIKLDL